MRKHFKSSSKILSIILAILMIFTAAPIMSFAEAIPAPEDTISDEMSARHIEHETPFTFTEGEVPAGSYYLEDDIALTGDLTITSEVHLCMNGKVLNINGDHQIYVTGTGSALNLYDCQETVHKFSTSEDGRYWVLDEEDGDIEVIGGVITGGYLVSADKWTSLISITNGAFNIYKANIVGNAFYYTGEKDYNHLVYMKDGIFNMYSGSVSGNVSINVDGETPSGPALFYIFRSTSFLGKYAVFSYNLAETCHSGWMCPLIYYYKTDAEVYGEFSNNNLAQRTTDDDKIILLITTCTVNFYGKIENNNGGELFWVRSNAYANMDGTISGNNCFRAVYCERTAVTDINGTIADNTCTYAVYTNQGETTINGTISNNTCTYAVYTYQGETTINGTVSDNVCTYAVDTYQGETTINGTISNNTCTYAVYTNQGETTINGTISNNTCSSYPVLVTVNSTFTLNGEISNNLSVNNVASSVIQIQSGSTAILNGKILDNKGEKANNAILARWSDVIIGENFEMDGNTYVDGTPVTDIYIMTQESEEYDVATITFEKQLDDELTVSFGNWLTKEYEPEKAIINIGEGIDAEELVEKLKGVQGIEDFELDENGNIVCVPHVHNEEPVPQVDATCTENGWTEYVKCSKCGLALDGGGHEIPATGHSEEEIPAVAPSCTEAGLTAGSKCSVCGEVLTAQEVDPATGHSYKATIVAPTCTEDGYTLYTCACGDSYKAEPVEATGHNAPPMTLSDEIPATCTEDGYVKAVCCVDCGEVLVDAVVIPATGHTEEIIPAVAPTCIKKGLTEGKKCSTCGKILVAQNDVRTIAHNFVETARVEAKCERNGYIQYTCSECGATRADILPALKHNYVEASRKEATCTEEGSVTYACSKCNATRVDELSKKSHVDSDMNGKCDDCGTQFGKRCKFCERYEMSIGTPLEIIFRIVHIIVHFFTAK